MATVTTSDLVPGLDDLTPDPDAEAVRALVRQMLADHCPEERVRELMETGDGHDPGLWLRMATEIGLQSLLVPEVYGGAGATPREMLTVSEELGAALYPGPFLASAVLATSVLLAVGDGGANQRLLPGLVDGSRIATLAVAEQGTSWRADEVHAEATLEGTGWRISGRKAWVLDGHLTDLLLVAARTGAGVSLFEVPGDSTRVTRTPRATLDQTRRLADVELTNAPATLLGAEGGAGAAIDAAVDLSCLAIAAEQLGGARRCLEQTVAYAKTRTQFGRPIGAFQAVKHRCADMLVHVERATSALRYAGYSAAIRGDEELAVLAPLVKSTCSETYLFVAGQCIQLHGGIGFAWEHSAHLHLKRAQFDATLLGDVRTQRELLATRIGL
jgi:alkylation response protein AidB-like acyl-CoA dehydrogenase